MSLITKENITKYGNYQRIKTSIVEIKGFIKAELVVMDKLKDDATFIELLNKEDANDIKKLCTEILAINSILEDR